MSVSGLGVDREHSHLDRAYSGTTRARPGLDKALVADRARFTLWSPCFSASMEG